MTALDTKLIARCRQLRQEIKRTEGAQEPVAALVERALGQFDRDVATFRASGSILAGTGVAVGLSFVVTGSMVHREVMAALGAMPATAKEARKLVEHRAKAAAESVDIVRMDLATKERRLIELRGELRQSEAQLEQQRRAVELETGKMAARVEDSVAVWMLRDVDLARAVAGQPPEELSDDDRPAETATRNHHAATAGVV
jgi:hypothetical protein